MEQIYVSLALGIKAQTKTASENDICLSYLLHISIQADRVDPYQTLLHQEQSDLHSLSMRLLKHSQRRQMQIFFVVIAALMLKCLYCDLFCI